MKLTVLALACLAVAASGALAASASEGAAFYVAPDGSDSGAGTVAK